MKNLAFGCSLFVLAFAAHAYEFDFVGRVTYTDGSLSSVAEGTLLQGHFQAEGPSSDYEGFGWTDLASYSFASGQVSVSINGHVVSASSPSIRIYDDAGSNVEDGFSMSSGYPLVVDGVTYQSGAFGFNLTTQPGNSGAIHGLALPDQINVADFDGHSSLTYGYMQRDGAPGGAILQFEVLSVAVSAVPEPSTAGLLLAGLLGVAGGCRRHARVA